MSNEDSAGTLSVRDPVSLVNMETHAPYDKWFNRFIRVADYPWAEGAVLNQVISPWVLYFSAPSVKNKLQGFSRFSCDGLEILFKLNGSPFQYGLILCYYKPLVGGGGTTDIGGAAWTLPHLASQDAAWMHGTTLPHVKCNVSTNAGGNLKVPFVCPKNFIELHDETDTLRDLTSMGEINIISRDELRSVGTATGAPITLSIFVRPIGLNMMGPTAYEIQCDSGDTRSNKDEYGDTPVAKTAGVVARAAGALTRVPWIGPYALATQIGASAVSKIASLFGFSSPPVISPVHNFISCNSYGMSTCGIPVQLERQTVDPKCELTVDQSVIGAPPGDDLALERILDKDVVIGGAIMYTTDPPDTPLFSMYITPEFGVADDIGPTSLYPYSAQYGYQRVTLTPSCHVAQTCAYWRGPITVTIMAVTSQLHRGRVMIEYDPVVGNAAPSSAPGDGLKRQWIMDLASTPTLSIEIGMLSATAWLETKRVILLPGALTNRTFFASRTAHPPTDSQRYFNGVLRAFVLNDLTSNGSSQIDLLVSINAKKVEFACPQEIPGFPSTYESQADTNIAAEPTDADSADGMTSNMDDNLSKVYHGEIITSLRPLLKRMVPFQTLVPYPTTTSEPSDTYPGYSFDTTNTTFNKLVMRWQFPRSGMQIGRVFAGPTWNWMYTYSAAPTAPGLVDFVYGKPTILAWFQGAFAGYRGSIRYRAYVNPPSHSSYLASTLNYTDLEIGRASTFETGMRQQNGRAIAHNVDPANSVRGRIDGTYALQNAGGNKAGWSRAVYDGRSLYVGVDIPDYHNYRFRPGNPQASLERDVGTAANDLYGFTRPDMVEVRATLQAWHEGTGPTQVDWSRVPTVSVYQSAGEDFSFVWYLAPPVFYTTADGKGYDG